MIDQLKTYAKAHHVPIISDDGLLFITDIIKKEHIKNVLEIGTAIGYSAIGMVLAGALLVDTFERDDKMLIEAKKNTKDFKEIHIIGEDALMYEGKLNTYDLIFIDAAKAQYQKFFDKFTPFLNEGGLVVCDNLSFHHLNPDEVSRHTRQLLRKIDTFKTYLKTHPDFETVFYDVGDGMSITKKRVAK